MVDFVDKVVKRKWIAAFTCRVSQFKRTMFIFFMEFLEFLELFSDQFYHPLL